jgi:predicted nicotinamide N-methyase
MSIVRRELVNLSLAGLDIQFSRVENFDALLDDLIAKGTEHPDYQDDRIPYWADLWHSGLALAEYLLLEKVIAPAMSVTEIGCGLGLPGLVAAMQGGEVLFTDYLPEALEQVDYNWSLNLPGAARSRVMDWRFPLAEAKAQLLLAADVAYEKRAFEPLVKAFAALSETGGRIIVTEPGRERTSDWLEMLAKQWPNHVSTTASILYREVEVTVNIMDIRV